MYEELNDEWIVKKVGGRFRLSALIQKRLVQLNRGSRPLVELQDESRKEDKMAIVLQEILQDKIYLDSSNELRIAGEAGPSEQGPELNLRDM